MKRLLIAAIALTLSAPPALAADALVVSIWGGSWRDLVANTAAKKFTQETGVPVIVADDPQRCVAKGAGAALDYVDVIQRSMPTEEESLIADRG